MQFTSKLKTIAAAVTCTLLALPVVAGSGPWRADSQDTVAPASTHVLLLVRGGGGGGGGGGGNGGGGNGPGDGDGNGGAAPGDGTGYGPKTGDCINS
jgi:hypothetical protein